MASRLRRQIITLGFLVALTSGCSPYASFRVETAIHPDGSCDRTIWQPKNELLPEEALKPDWKARWQTVADADGPKSDIQAASPPGVTIRLEQKQLPYFSARGTFSSPQQIPAHYRYADEKCPEVGTSELVRTYERTDYGFVVEHRWREKITNSVTLAGFLSGRDELFDLVIPIFIDALEKGYGQDFDLGALSSFLRKDGRRVLEDVSLALYDTRSRGQWIADDSASATQVYTQLATAAKRAGLDFFDEHGKLISNADEINRRAKAYARRLFVQYVKHRDGRALLPAEADALIQSAPQDPRNQRASEVFGKAIQERMKQDKVFEKRIRAAFLGAAGIYGPFEFPFSQAPVFEFVLRLPGELVETNGTGTEHGTTRWKFTSQEIYPDGYAMKARSLLIDRNAQKTTLGRAVIDDEKSAFEFMALVGADGPLLEAVRAFSKMGDRKLLTDLKTRNPDEAIRADKLRKLLSDR